MDAPLGLSAMYPRREILLLGGTLRDVGLYSDSVLRVEPDSVEFDPFTIFKEACQVRLVTHVPLIAVHRHIVWNSTLVSKIPLFVVL